MRNASRMTVAAAFIIGALVGHSGNTAASDNPRQSWREKHAEYCFTNTAARNYFAALFELDSEGTYDLDVQNDYLHLIGDACRPYAFEAARAIGYQIAD